MAREVRLLTPGDIASAASAIASGHGDYPAFRAVWPDPDRRRRALTAFFAATVRDGLSFGATHGVVTDGRVDAVAVWLPPGAFPWSARRKARATPSFLRVAAADPQAFSRFARYGATAERHHPEGDHWYLVVLSCAEESSAPGSGPASSCRCSTAQTPMERPVTSRRPTRRTSPSTNGWVSPSVTRPSSSSPTDRRT